MRLLNIQRSWQRIGQFTLGVAAALALNTCAPLPGTLEQIKAAGELRVVTRDGPLTYLRGLDGTETGPEYTLAYRFAAALGVHLKIITVRGYDDIYDALRSGRAHLAAAALKVPVDSIPGVAFGPVYARVQEHLVYRRGGLRPASLKQVGAGTLQVAAGGTPAKMLRTAQASLPGLQWTENTQADTRGLLDGVAQGDIDYTIADSMEFSVAHDAHTDLRIAFDFPGTRSVAWAVSDRDPDFRTGVARYFTRLESSGALAAIVDRYGRTDGEESAPAFMRHLHNRLPLYKKWFVEAGEQNSQDWRLLAAIGYQESKWNPRAASAAGAQGLMQLTGRTATAANVTDRVDPRQSIFAGAQYFRQVYSKIPTHVPEPDKTWFALAAYNVGYGHLEDARVLTQRGGYDPDSWDDVRDFLPLLEHEEWYSKTENGYANGLEPVRYVDRVRGYRDMLEWAAVGGKSL
ncbi:MAG: membrane-bound lytic murein transglycosylase MltF [Pseudomonadota bacterium]|nr:membrane-bound lytic murein transglycosylase MltF [Pseudomonadota bacterium]